MGCRRCNRAVMATLEGSSLHVRAEAGPLTQLEKLLAIQLAPGCLGLGQTCQVAPTTGNHRQGPSLRNLSRVVVFHKGTITNYKELCNHLDAEGYGFNADHPDEVLACLLDWNFGRDLIRAVQKAVAVIQGSCALCILSPEEPDLLMGITLGSPLLTAGGQEGFFLATDAAILSGRFLRITQLKQRHLCVLTPEEGHLLDWR